MSTILTPPPQARRLAPRKCNISRCSEESALSNERAGHVSVRGMTLHFYFGRRVVRKHH